MSTEDTPARVDVWMPLYVGDYLADTARLTTEEHGAYLLLIMDYWRSGSPPDDNAVLAQICKCTSAAWKKLRPAIVGYFRIKNRRWIHNRIDREKHAAAQRCTAASSKARMAAQARWKNAQGNPPSIRPSNAPSTARAMLEQCPSPSPSSSPSNSHTPSPQPGGAGGTGGKPPAASRRRHGADGFDPLTVDLPLLLATDVFRMAWTDWVQHRREKRKPLTPLAVKKQLGELAEWGEARAVAAIEHTIKRGWEGIREDDRYVAGNGNSHARRGELTAADHAVVDARIEQIYSGGKS